MALGRQGNLYLMQIILDPFFGMGFDMYIFDLSKTLFANRRT